jgi:hypothetical protein
MKKLFLVLTLLIGALAVNAQRTPIKVAELQKTITDNITKDHVGFTVKEATKVVDKEMVCYEVIVAKGTTQETLCYDKDGKFMKKLAAKVGTVEKQNVKPASHSVTPPAKKK